MNPKGSKEVCGIKFGAYGAHHSAFPQPYLTVAAALGIRKEEVDVFLSRLDDVLREYAKEKEKDKAKEKETAWQGK